MSRNRNDGRRCRRFFDKWYYCRHPQRGLRRVLLLLIVAFHSLSAYIVTQPTTPPAFDLPPYDWRVFPIIDNERWLGFDLFCEFQFLYLMQFMFFLSGLF